MQPQHKVHYQVQPALVPRTNDPALRIWNVDSVRRWRKEYPAFKKKCLRKLLWISYREQKTNHHTLSRTALLGILEGRWRLGGRRRNLYTNAKEWGGSPMLASLIIVQDRWESQVPRLFMCSPLTTSTSQGRMKWNDYSPFHSNRHAHCHMCECKAIIYVRSFESQSS